MFPNPLKRRDAYTELADGWEFSLDGVRWQAIRVPYCPQSRLSGIEYTDFIPRCFYRLSFQKPWTTERTVLHFGAVDYRAVVSVNGSYIGSHVGGYTPFEFDITDVLHDGENLLELTVYDENRDIPFGKQSYRKHSFGCFYTRTTGIWQPVWLENRPQAHIRDFYFYPDAHNGAVDIELISSGKGTYRVDVSYEGKTVGSARADMAYKTRIHVPLAETHLWEPGQGRLYDVRLTFGDDVVHSYFGLRNVAYCGDAFLLNGREVFQRLVLDQGYYPEGIYTAPDEEAMRQDIRNGMRLGFNGARLHQKVFDPRYLYECDRAGYMVWGEYPSWGIDYAVLDGLGTFLEQWQEAIKRDFNHPSIILWCPLNEVWGAWEDPQKLPDIRFVETVYDVTKRIDPTRPCVDASGGYHGKHTDLYDFHCYESAEKLHEYLQRWQQAQTLDVPLLNRNGVTTDYRPGQPVNISECGGFAFGDQETEKHDVCAVNEGAVQPEEAWGYGPQAQDAESFIRRFRQLVELMQAYPGISGYCYTQLYDVEQETNGFYRYDRTSKLTQQQMDVIRDIQCKR